MELGEVLAALDLWGAMWTAEERTAFETAVVRAMTDQHARRTRLSALATARVIDTPRLRQAANRAAQRFTVEERAALEREVAPIRRRYVEAQAVRGNQHVLEWLLAQAVSGVSEGEADADALLDWVDVRDLVATAFATADLRIYREIEHRVARRGPHQRAKVAARLGFRVEGPDGRPGGHRPETGELRKIA
jgi:hypothetical protein